MQITPLETERLILRGVTEADAPAYEKHFVDWEIIGQLGAVVPWPYPRDGVRDFICNRILPEQGKDKWVWGIFRKEDPTGLIGVVDLWRHGRPENRGFWLGRAYWGRGYMTEAVEVVMDHAFGPLGFETLVFTNARGNVRSRRIKEKTGARLVRVEPRHFVNPDYTESEVWELTKADWERWKSRRGR
jgi:ribosomal-protein-alanine N-acetyltransferase